MQGIVSLISGSIDAAMNTLPSVLSGAQSQESQFQKLRSLQENLKGIDDILTQGNGENSGIPLVFGKATLAGNLIWYNNLTSQIIQNNGITIQNSFDYSFIQNLLDAGSMGTTLLSGFGINKPKSATFSTVYKLDFAIGICEGEIDELLEVCVNGQVIDLTKYKYSFYKGTQTQTVDAIIAKDKNLAFKGLCYIVFEQFPISDFGTSMPKFTFTVQRNISRYNPKSINNLIKGVTLIPASGEFCYHTQITTKYKVRGTKNGDVLLQDSKKVLNANNNSNKADVLVSLDQLQSQLPNLEWVSVIVNWFGDSMDISNCSIFPACEYNDYNMVTLPDEWTVAGKKRTQTRVIGRDSNGNLRYGGTPSDGSVVALLTELKNRGIKVAFTPMLMMDCDQKPWRGRLTGSPSNIANFFHKNDGYNAFISHYANLTKGLVDCFVIGTEMVGLTKINHNNTFPAVDEFCSLANSIRSIVGTSTKLTYAADWSEYHHTDGGFYNMDALWANSNIDFIGLDAYFPLTQKNSQPLISEIENGWNAGEGWDFYYNHERTQKIPLSQEWAWKNIRWFIENEHINSDGTRTQWKPKMKKVWFMEYGFPSVDLCTNQPNVFYDESSSESAFPRGSKGMVDFQAQSDAIVTTENFWSKNSDIVENKFVWTWDARPFPFFPLKTDVWADCSNWQFGHWLNGKVMSCQVSDLVEFLLIRAGIENYEIRDVNGVMNGVVLKGLISYKTILGWVLLLYNLRIFQENGRIVVDSMRNLKSVSILSENIVIDEAKAEILNVSSSSGIVFSKVILSFYNVDRNCATSIIHVGDDSKNGGEFAFAVPFVLSESVAQNLARKVLVFLNSMTMQKITLPSTQDYLKINVGNLINFFDGENEIVGLVEKFHFDGTNIEVEFVKMQGVLLDIISQNIIVADGKVSLKEVAQNEALVYEIIDINNFTNKGCVDGTFPLWFAFKNVQNGKLSGGISAYYSKEQNGSYIKIFDEDTNSTMGKVLDGTDFAVDFTTTDEINTITVEVSGQELKSISDSDFFAMKNLCIIGNEICAFRDVKKLGDGVYELSHLLRARFGSNIETITDGKRFVLLSGYINRVELPFDVSNLYFKFVQNGQTLETTDFVEFLPQKLGISQWKVQNVQKTLQTNGDILFSWKEQVAIRSGVFVNSGTNLRAFSVVLSSRNFPIEVVGVNYFVYTKEMQIADGIIGLANFDSISCEVFLL